MHDEMLFSDDDDEKIDMQRQQYAKENLIKSQFHVIKEVTEVEQN